MRVPAALEQWAFEHNEQLSAQTLAEVEAIAAALADSPFADRTIGEIHVDPSALATIFSGPRVERAVTLIEVVAKWAAKRPVVPAAAAEPAVPVRAETPGPGATSPLAAPPLAAPPLAAPPLAAPPLAAPPLAAPPLAAPPLAAPPLAAAPLTVAAPATTTIAAPAFLRSDKVDEEDDHRLYGPSRRWRAIIGGAVGLVALAGAIAGGWYWFTQRDSSEPSETSTSAVVDDDAVATDDQVAPTPAVSPEPAPTEAPTAVPLGYWADITQILNTGTAKIEASTYVVSRANRAVLTGHLAAITGIAIADDGRVLTSGADRRLVDWGADVTLASPDVLSVASPLTVLIRTVDQRVVAGDTDGAITIIDLVKAVEPILLDVHDVAISSIAELSDGRFAVASVDGEVAVFAVDTPEDRVVLPHGAEVTAVVGLPDGGVATASVDGVVRLWSADGTEEPGEVSTLGGPVTALTLLDDGQLAAGSVDGAIHIVPATAGAPETLVLAGHLGAVRALHPTTVNGVAALASGGDDTTVRIWSLVDATEIYALEGHGDIVSGIAELPDGRLVTVSGDGTGRVWDLAIATLPSVLPPHGLNMSRLVVLGNDQFVSGANDGTVVLSSTAETTQPQAITRHGAPIVGLVVGEEGAVISLDANSILRVTDLSGQELAPERTLAAGATSLARRGSDGIVVGHADGTVRYDDLTAEVTVVEAHGSGVSDVLVHSTGVVISAGQDKTVRIIDLDDPDAIKVFDLHTAPVDRVVELADGRIASAGSDGIYIWSLEGLSEEVVRLTGHRSRTLSMVSISDTQLVTSGDDGKVRLWDLTDPEAEAATLIDIPGIVNPLLIRAGNGSFVAGAARGYVVFGLPS